MLLFGWVGCRTQLLRCTDLHKAVSNDKAQSKSLTDLRDAFLAQVSHYFCSALGGASSAQVPVCYREKWPREGAKMLLKGETINIDAEFDVNVGREWISTSGCGKSFCCAGVGLMAGTV